MSFRAEDIIAYGSSIGSGLATDGFWAQGAVLLFNPSYSIFRDIYFFGIGGAVSASKNNNISYGFAVVADNGRGSVLNFFENCFANNCQNGFYFSSRAQPGMEGTFMSHCNVVAVTTGVHVDCTVSGYYPPELHIHDSQFECITYGINTNHVAECYFHDNLIYDQPEPHSMSNGILATDCQFVQISGGHIVARPGNANMVGIALNSTTNGARIHHIDISTPSWAVGIFDSCSHIEAYEGIRQSGSGGLVADVSSGVATNKSGEQIGNPGFVWTGDVLEQFGSITVSCDGSGNFSASFPRQFPNAVFSIQLTNGFSPAGNQIPTVTARTTSGFNGCFQGSGSGNRQLDY